MLVSAGNITPDPDRPSSPDGDGTVVSPAEAKDAVTVGAHFNPDTKYGTAPQYLDPILTVGENSAR